MTTISSTVQILHGYKFLVDAAWQERVAASVFTRCYRRILPYGEVAAHLGCRPPRPLDWQSQ